MIPNWMALESFLLDRTSRNLATATVEFYRIQLDKLMAFLESRNVNRVSEISPDDLRLFLVDLASMGLSEASVHAAARAAKAFLVYCVQEDWIQTSPMDRVQMPRVTHEALPALTADQIMAIRSACENSRDRAAVNCLLDTGARASEFIPWTVGDLDLDNGLVYLKHTKNRRGRVVYLGKRSRLSVARWISELTESQTVTPSTYLWQNLAVGRMARPGEPLTRHGLRRLIQRLGERAGVPDLTTHDFRRTFAVWSILNGMDAFRLRVMLGHSNMDMVNRYIAIASPHLKDAADLYGVVDSLEP